MKTLGRIESIEFEIWTLKDIIDSFERSIRKTKKKPLTRKRKLYIKECESVVKDRKERLQELEIEKELLEIKERSSLIENEIL